MKELKKIVLPFFCLWAIIPSGISQGVDSDKKESSVKPFCAVEANCGLTARKKTTLYPDLNAKLSIQDFVVGGNFTGGIKLSHYFKIGFGLGYFYYEQYDGDFFSTYNFANCVVELSNTTTHGIPLFFYLRSDFSDKKVTPYLDFKIGNNFLITEEKINVWEMEYYMYHLYQMNYGDYKLKNGLYFAINAGVAFKLNTKITLNASGGYQYVSRYVDRLYGGLGLEMQYVKTCYTVADHQFLFNVGVSF